MYRCLIIHRYIQSGSYPNANRLSADLGVHRRWEVVRKNDRKVVLTPFGAVEFKRRYYRHRDSKEYKYLVDEKFGITPHQKVGTKQPPHGLERYRRRQYGQYAGGKGKQGISPRTLPGCKGTVSCSGGD